MIRERLQRFALALYGSVAESGVLEWSWAREAHDRAYFLYKRFFEARAAGRLCDWIAPGTSVIDVGANIGFFTIRFAERVSAGGRVFALEPEAVNYGRLRKTLSRTPVGSRVEPIRAAAADASGDGFLEINPHNPGDHTLGAAGEPVAVVAIDDLLAGRGWPAVSLIKIDVQGAEARVLAGARRTLDAFRPAIFLEVHEPSLRRHRTDGRTVLEACLRSGYSAHVLSRRGLSRTMTVDEVLELEARRGYVDVLLLANAMR